MISRRDSFKVYQTETVGLPPPFRQQILCARPIRYFEFTHTFRSSPRCVVGTDRVATLFSSQWLFRGGGPSRQNYNLIHLRHGRSILDVLLDSHPELAFPPVSTIRA
jgi:hypothetical protein